MDSSAAEAGSMLDNHKFIRGESVNQKWCQKRHIDQKISTRLKLCVATATHNFKWVKIEHSVAKETAEGLDQFVLHI